MDKVFSNPDVYRVRVPFVNLGKGESNCYIVRDGGACLVVDPGAASEVGMARVRACLAELGVASGTCEAFLTHTHFDHSEATRFLFPEGVRVHMSRVGFAEREPERAEAARVRMVERMMAMGATAEDAEAYSRCDFEPTVLPEESFDYRFVGDGDEVRVGRFAFDVVETPGHTLDHLCLIGRDGAPSFTGDEVLFGTTPCVDAPYGDQDALGMYLESLDAEGPRGAWLNRISAAGAGAASSADRSEGSGDASGIARCVGDGSGFSVGEGDAKCVLPGHGEPFDGEALRARAVEIIDRKLAHCERLRELSQACPDMTAEELARRALTRKDEIAWRAASPMSRYYTLLEAYVDLRHLRGSKGQSL